MNWLPRCKRGPERDRASISVLGMQAFKPTVATLLIESPAAKL
jgi:hypothetical protein